MDQISPFANCTAIINQKQKALYNMDQISPFANCTARDIRRRRDKTLIKPINQPPMISTYKEGYQIRNLLNASFRAGSIAINATQTYIQLKVEFSKLHEISSIDKAPTSKNIEDLQLAIDKAESEMLKTTLNSTILTEKLNDARELNVDRYSNINYIDCHKLEQDFFK